MGQRERRMRGKKEGEREMSYFKYQTIVTVNSLSKLEDPPTYSCSIQIPLLCIQQWERCTGSHRVVVGWTVDDVMMTSLLNTCS